MILKDGVEYKHGMVIYWFGIYQRLEGVGLDLRLYSSSDEVDEFGYTPKCGYYSNYESATVALYDESRKEYTSLMQRHLDTMRVLKDEANSNAEKMSFSIESEVHTFKADEIEIMRGIK